MKSNHRDEELLDDSPTDELPVLSELDVVDDFERTSVFTVLDDAETGRHRPLRLPGRGTDDADDGLTDRDEPTSRFRIPDEDWPAGSAFTPGDSAEADGPSADAASAQRIRELEARVAEMTVTIERDRALLADSEASIASLEERLAATREAVTRRDDVQRQLRTALAEREAAAARAHETVQRLEAAAATREAAAETRESAAAAREAAAAQLEAALAEREARLVDCETALEELEAELAARSAELDGRTAALDQRVTAVEAREAALRETATQELRQIAASREALQRHVEAQLRAYAALETRLESREADAGALADRRLAEPDALAETGALAERDAHTETGALAERDTLAETGTLVDTDTDDPQEALRRSREHAAALASYIEGRRAYWYEMEARIAEQKARIDELSAELEQRAGRQQQAQQVADAQSRRVEDLKAEVAALRRLVESRRGAAAPTPEPVPPAAPAATATAAAATAAAAVANEPDSQIDEDTAAHTLPSGGDRDARIEALITERDALRDRLDRNRDSLRRLERLLVERDRALEASHSRLRSLQGEGGPDIAAGDAQGTGPARSAGTDAARGPDAAAPALVCLTGDAPRSFPMRKASITLGRGGHCDVQITTHFVSREHARLSVRPGNVQIEDLGSKNGVFVNAVRIERETLRHGDLITIGETQFRFMAEERAE